MSAIRVDAQQDRMETLYQTQGRFEEAEPLALRALAIREQQLGPNHARTADSLAGLAILCYYQGKYMQVEPLLQRALQIYEQQLGETHHRAMDMRHNLALLFMYQGRYEEAEKSALRVLAKGEHAQRALLGRAHSMGQDHPETIDTRAPA